MWSRGTDSTCDGPQVPYYDYALDMILDADSPNNEILTEEQHELVESAAEMLYGLIHVRYILTTRGMSTMFEKYKQCEFGRCPRVLCNDQPTLPVGLADAPRQNTVKIYCPRCGDIYCPRYKYQARLPAPPLRAALPSCLCDVRLQLLVVSQPKTTSSCCMKLPPRLPHAAASAMGPRACDCCAQSNVDGAYFGTTFPHLLLMTYPGLRPPRQQEVYVPRVFGFKLHSPSKREGQGAETTSSEPMQHSVQVCDACCNLWLVPSPAAAVTRRASTSECWNIWPQHDDGAGQSSTQRLCESIWISWLVGAQHAGSRPSARTGLLAPLPPTIPVKCHNSWLITDAVQQGNLEDGKAASPAVHSHQNHVAQ